ncbi:rod shape-determining protein MreD [Filifactor villosus]|uniref:Rod shape-determining protein MreD n=1 Tax=Filifactor villosus TaxID=29374 RepID=A0ABV9QJB8_9FIRM
MRNLIFFIIGLAVILVELFFLNDLHIISVNINLLLIYMVCIALFSEIDKALFLALLMGLAKDFTVERIVGVNALIFIVIALVIRRLKEVIYKDKPMTPFLFLLLSSFLYSMVYIALYKLYLGRAFMFSYVATNIPIFVFVETVLGTLLFLPIKKMIYQIQDRW